MEPKLTAIAISIILILCMELLLWFVFSRKIEGLMFPREADQSYFKFFTMARLRSIAVLHTFVLTGISAVSIYFLW